MKKECFDSIDNLPLFNWWKITDTGDLKWLYKEEVKKADVKVYDLWEKIHNEYLEDYGLTPDFKQMLKLKKKWIIKQAEYIQGNRFASTEASIVDAKIQDLTSGEGMKREDTIIFLEERLGRELDPKKMTVRKYNDYIKYYSKK